MRKAARHLIFAIILLALPLLRPAFAAVSTCEPDGTQASGAVYRICMPRTWNGDLERMYLLKTLLSGSYLRRHINIRVDRYGHCNFKAPEVRAAFVLMVTLANHQAPVGAEAVLPDAASREAYRSILRAYGPLS